MLKTIKTVLAVSAMALMTACGGGGGGGGGTTLQTTGLPVAATFENIFTTSGTYTATSADGASTLTLTITPTADGQFSQSTAQSKTVDFLRVVRTNGVVTDTAQATMYFNTSPLTFVAVEGRAVDTSTTVPATGDVNATGQAYFSAGAGRGLFSTSPQEGVWSLEQASGKVFLCLKNTLGYGLLSQPGFETTTITTYCFAVNGAGKTTGFKATQSTDQNSTGNTSVVDTVSFQ